ncbi:Mannosyl-oligosaccharide 1,2-alpha-mannosidase IB, partial [Quaeritorhiza haematococci]
MIEYAWNAYEQHALGYDELQPLTQSGHNWYGHSLLLTAVDSLDTLFLANLTTSYNRAKSFVLSNLNPRSPILVNAFETNIRVVGGLLGAYELDGDERLLEKAVEVADALLPAFETPTGIPVGRVNMSSGEIDTTKATTSLAEAGTFGLEFQYLSDVTGNPKYAAKAISAMDQIWAQERPVKGLIPLEVNIQKIKSHGHGALYGVGGAGDSFYEYVLKLWIATKEPRFRDMYLESADAIAKHLVQRSRDGSHVYIPDAWISIKSSRNSDDGSQPHVQFWPKSYFHHLNKATGLGFEYVNGQTLKAENAGYASRYLLRPEVIESIFYMWRLTRDPKYRDWGWEIAQNIETHCKVPDDRGYSGLLTTTTTPASHANNQDSYFIAETLKYLLLLFSPPTADGDGGNGERSGDVLPLD